MSWIDRILFGTDAAERAERAEERKRIAIRTRATSQVRAAEAARSAVRDARDARDDALVLGRRSDPPLRLPSMPSVDDLEAQGA